MNRLRPKHAHSIDKNLTLNQLVSPPAVMHTPQDICSFFLPVHYEANYQYPLVIWLHENGRDQTQMPSVLSNMSLQNYVGAGVRASRAVDPMGHAFSWIDSESGIAIAEQSVYDVVDETQRRYSIERNRIFLAGHREGGTMALRIALRNPEAFAGAISLGGKFPNGHRPLANLHAIRSLPLLMALGTNDDVYPVDDLCGDLRTLHTAKIGLHLRQYDVADELSPQILSEINEWIMGQVTNTNTLDSHLMCDTEPVEFSAN